MNTEITKYNLPESEIPTHWYNIVADLPTPPPPPLHPGTHEPIGPADLAPLFPMELIKQEVSRPSATSRSRTRCARSTSSGGRRR